MDDAPEPVDGRDAEPSEAAERPRSGLRSLDRRTVAICVCLAVIAALVAGLVASLVLDDGNARAGGDSAMTLQEPTKIDTSRLLAQPLDDPAGGTTKLGAFLDEQPLLVNIWASNCSPCRKEMPLLQQAADANPGVTFVGVATQDRPEAAATFAKDRIDYPWALDPTGEFLYEARGAGMPTTLLLSKDGEVVASHTGGFTSAAQLQRFIDEAS